VSFYKDVFESSMICEFTRILDSTLLFHKILIHNELRTSHGIGPPFAFLMETHQEFLVSASVKLTTWGIIGLTESTATAEGGRPTSYEIGGDHEICHTNYERTSVAVSSLSSREVVQIGVPDAYRVREMWLEV
jgi:hypothetical protein